MKTGWTGTRIWKNPTKGKHETRHSKQTQRETPKERAGTLRSSGVSCLFRISDFEYRISPLLLLVVLLRGCFLLRSSALGIGGWGSGGGSARGGGSALGPFLHFFLGLLRLLDDDLHDADLGQAKRTLAFLPAF